MPAAGLKAAIMVNDVCHVVKGIAAKKYHEKKNEREEMLQMKLKNM